LNKPRGESPQGGEKPVTSNKLGDRGENSSCGGKGVRGGGETLIDSVKEEKFQLWGGAIASGEGLF